MYICMYAYVYIYIYIRVCVAYAYIYTYIYIYILYIYIYICIYILYIYIYCIYILYIYCIYIVYIYICVPYGLLLISDSAPLSQVQHIVLCGHYDCGGISAAVRNDDHPSPLANWLRNIRDVYRRPKRQWNDGKMGKNWKNVAPTSLICSANSSIIFSSDII